LQSPHIQGAFFALACTALHPIALAVVSEWCQKHKIFRVNRLFLSRFVYHSPSPVTSDYGDQPT